MVCWGKSSRKCFEIYPRRCFQESRKKAVKKWFQKIGEFDFCVKVVKNPLLNLLSTEIQLVNSSPESPTIPVIYSKENNIWMVSYIYGKPHIQVRTTRVGTWAHTRTAQCSKTIVIWNNNIGQIDEVWSLLFISLIA